MTAGGPQLCPGPAVVARNDRSLVAPPSVWTPGVHAEAPGEGPSRLLRCHPGPVSDVPSAFARVPLVLQGPQPLDWLPPRDTSSGRVGPCCLSETPAPRGCPGGHAGPWGSGGRSRDPSRVRPEPVPLCVQGRVCGLCGNFDGNALNDFTTRSQSVVGDVLEFGNSWKFSPSCPDARAPKDPCTANPYRKSWAQKQCSIINSATFSACRAHVRGLGRKGQKWGLALATRTCAAGHVGPQTPGAGGPAGSKAPCSPRARGTVASKASLSRRWSRPGTTRPA